MNSSFSLYSIRLEPTPAPACAENIAAEPIQGPKDLAALARLLLETDERERFGVLFLDARNRAKGFHLVSIGHQTAALVHPREAYRAAIVAGANAVIFVHNHPSGDSAPSREDRALTDRLKRAGELLDIRVLDHVILGDFTDTFFSFAESGEL